MHEKVEAYLNKKKEEQAEKELSERNQILLDAGLYDKKYVDSEELLEGTAHFWDNEAEKAYVLDFINVTEEEFEEIKKYSTKPKDIAENSNTIAVVFKFLGWLTYIVGFIMGLVLGSAVYDFNIIIALAYWVGAFITGTIFLGFAEIINLLHSIKNK